MPNPTVEDMRVEDSHDNDQGGTTEGLGVEGIARIANPVEDARHTFTTFVGKDGTRQHKMAPLTMCTYEINVLRVYATKVRNVARYHTPEDAYCPFLSNNILLQTVECTKNKEGRKTDDRRQKDRR